MTVNLAKPGDTWYRIDDVVYAPPVGEDGEPHGPGRLDVVLREYNVTKVTPKGVWVQAYMYPAQFVLWAARKRHCHPTIELALESFISRKNRQASIYRARVSQAERAMRLAIGRYGSTVKSTITQLGEFETLSLQEFS